jgi:RHS repeat-associated protein
MPYTFIDAPGWQAQIADNLGETRQLTDSGGNIVNTYLYTAYGVPVATTGTDYNPHRFGGQFGYYTDPYASQDMILCGARWYNASMGRWLSRDPSGYDEGTITIVSMNCHVPTVLVDTPARTPRIYVHPDRHIQSPSPHKINALTTFT